MSVDKAIEGLDKLFDWICENVNSVSLKWEHITAIMRSLLFIKAEMEAK